MFVTESFGCPSVKPDVDVLGRRQSRGRSHAQRTTLPLGVNDHLVLIRVQS